VPAVGALYPLNVSLIRSLVFVLVLVWLVPIFNVKLPVSVTILPFTVTFVGIVNVWFTYIVPEGWPAFNIAVALSIDTVTGIASLYPNMSFSPNLPLITILPTLVGVYCIVATPSTTATGVCATPFMINVKLLPSTFSLL